MEAGRNLKTDLSVSAVRNGRKKNITVAHFHEADDKEIQTAHSSIGHFCLPFERLQEAKHCWGRQNNHKELSLLNSEHLCSLFGYFLWGYWYLKLGT